MLRTRRPLLAGLAAGAVVLLAACSHPTPSPVPGATASSLPAPSTAPSTPAASGPATSGTVPSSPAPGTSATSPASKPPSGNASVEPNRPATTAPPKKLGESTRTAGAVVSLVSVRATTIKATAPGDRSGPGVLVRLRLVNSTGRTLDTSFTQVGVTGAGGTAGTLVDGRPTQALDPTVRAGRSVQGTYAFLMSDASGGPVTVSVFVTSGQPVVTFRGRAS